MGTSVFGQFPYKVIDYETKFCLPGQTGSDCIQDMPFYGIYEEGPYIDGYDGMLGLSPNSEFMKRLANKGGHNKSVTLFFGQPDWKQKSTAAFGCPLPAQIADGSAFTGDFFDVDVLTTGNTWTIPTASISFNTYSEVFQAPLSDIKPEYPAIALPKAILDAVFAEILKQLPQGT